MTSLDKSKGSFSLIEVFTEKDRALFHRVLDQVYAQDPAFIYPL